MNIWSGSITLGPDRLLEGIRLIDPTSHWQSDISRDSKLELRSFVNPALIPLHARAGPNLELHAPNPATSQWLQSKLTGAIWLNEDELDLNQSLQCPVGLLVSVNDSTIKRTGAVTSDLLIYGVLSSATSCARPPTPPHSSPFENNTNTNTNPSTTKPYELRVYAAPLSTTQLTQAKAFPSPPQSSNGEHVSAPAEFLPDISSPSPKRKRVATLFESAAQHHRRVRQRGGEAVSQMMAPIRPSSSSQNISSLRIKREPEDDQPGIPSLDRIAAQRSRSVSIGANLHRQGSFRGTRGPSVNLNADPQKRATTPNPFLEQSSSSRRGSQQIQAPSTLTSFSDEKEKPITTTSTMTTMTPSSPPKNPQTVIADNKNLITRTILTCMRLYGFHRSNTKSSSKPVTGGGSDPDPETSNATPAPEILRAETPAPGASADDDEFKAMYHATYKAAAFALRKYLKDPATGSGASPVLLEKDKAMTCIDELLRVFCEDH